MIQTVTEQTELQQYLGDRDIFDLDAVTLPVEVAGMPFWNDIDYTVRDRIIAGMLRNMLRRTIAHVPFYKYNAAWSTFPVDEISTLHDMFRLPVLSKDSIPGTGTPTRPGIHGFREKLVANPEILVPDNLMQLIDLQEKANPQHEQILAKYKGKKILEFHSGGSQGRSTITHLSYLSVEMEAHALVRCLRMNGFQEGQSIACFYNEEHKGGLQLERAADIMGMPFHSKRLIFDYLGSKGYTHAILGFQRALAEGRDSGSYAKEIRQGIRDYIRHHKINIIESVQPPPQFSQKNVKGNALAFMNLYEEDFSAFESVSHVFLTGFPVPLSAAQRLRKDGKIVSTTWGSTEAMALGTHSLAAESNVNNLIATPFPSIGIVAKYNERGLLQPSLRTVMEKESGLLLVTSLLGAGSTYINYLIGDIATHHKMGFTNIHRLSSKTISGSCAADALAI